MFNLIEIKTDFDEHSYLKKHPTLKCFGFKSAHENKNKWMKTKLWKIEQNIQNINGQNEKKKKDRI